MKNLNTLKKSALTIAIALGGFIQSSAQFVTIPDANFVAYLQANFPSAMNGNQMDTTDVSILNASTVLCSGLSISDLTGIEYFDNLATLNCSLNNLQNLPDLSNSLMDLDLRGNSISCLPILPNGLLQLQALNNPISCLPNIPNNGNFTSDIGLNTCYNLTPGVSDILISCHNACNGGLSVATSQPGNYDWVWSNGFIENNTQSSAQFGLCAGTYTVTVTPTGGGCVAAIERVLNNPPLISLTPIVDFSICAGDSSQVCLSYLNGTPPYTISINGQAPTITSQNPYCFYLNAGGAYIINSVSNGCVVQPDTFNVTLNPLPVLGIQTNVVACNLPVQICIPQVIGTPPFAYTWGTGDITQCISAPNVGVYSYTVTDPNGCTVSSSTNVSYSPGWQGIDFIIDSLPTCGQCDGGLTAVLSGGPGGPLTYLWSNSVTTQFNNAICDNQNGYVIVTDTANCVDTAFYNLDCYSVWPGDANNDGVANNVDILPIGIGYGTTDIIRPNATINWQAENCLNWIDTLANGTNYKHVDCNGDGIIADDDTIAILQNFGLIHPRLAQRVQNITDPPLYFDIVVDTVGTNQQLDIPLYFGTSAIPADSIYGMAFTVNYDTSLVKADSVQIGFSPSWLGTVGSDLIYIAKNDTQNGKLYVGVTRINQNDTSGFGEIARVTIVTTDNVSGRLSQPTYDTLKFTISDLTIINVNEIERNAFVTGDSLIIEDLTSIFSLNATDKTISIFPNPAQGLFRIKSGLTNVESVVVTDITGKQIIGNGNSTEGSIIRKLSNREFIVNADQLASGTYLVKINTAVGSVYRKIALVK